MANIAFPRVTPREQSIRLQTTVSRLRSPYARHATQLISRGAAWWVGTLTWGSHVWDSDINVQGQIDEITGFLDGMEGGIHTFDIPLAHLMKGKGHRFPAKDEMTNANSVQVTDVTPTTTSATQVGLASTLEVDTAATMGTGLRKGDWVSLHNEDLTVHHGAYRVINDQVGMAVAVAPSPPRLDTGNYRLISRAPTLRARLVDAPPAVNYVGEFYEPITIQWEQAT